MDHVREFTARPRLYNNIDGVAELGLGVMLLGYALVLWLMAWSPARSFWDRSAFILWIALMCGIHFGMKAVKNRITYPRTGFVEYRRRDRTRYAILSGMISALIPLLVLAAQRRHWDLWTAAFFFGPALAGSYAYHIARAARWKWAAVGAIGIGSVVIAFVPANILAALAGISLDAHPVAARLIGILLLSFLTYGPIVLVSGGITFWLYLRSSQPPG